MQDIKPQNILIDAHGEVVLADQPGSGVEALCFIAHNDDSGQTEFILALLWHCEGDPPRREMQVHEFARGLLRRGAGLRWVPGAARKKPREAENN